MFNLNLKTDTDCELKTGAWPVWYTVPVIVRPGLSGALPL